MGNGGSSSGGRWAADPSGRHAFRYWDGTRWTGHVADGAFAPSRVPGDPSNTPTGTQATVAPAATPAHPEAATVADPASTVAVGDAAEAAERPTRRRQQQQQRTRPHRVRTFLLGALTGAALVIAGVAVAVLVAKVKVNAPATAHHKATTTTATTPPTSAPTTTTSNAGRPPQLVRVEVINAQATANAAGAKALALGQLGYPSAGLADAPVRQGTVVQCKTGFEAEAATLAKNVGPGTTVEPFPNPAPPGSTNADCVVILGK